MTNRTSIVAVALMLAACGPGSNMSGAQGTQGAGGGASTCTARPCPPGIYPVCESVATPTTCCADGAPAGACEMAAGLLTHACPAACLKDLCAVSPSGTITCCDFETTPNPCAAAVP